MLISLLLIIYIFGITIAKPNTVINNNINLNILTFIMFSSLTWFITFRESMNDTEIYIWQFIHNQNISLPEALEQYPDKLFSALVWIIAQITDSPTLFLFLMWVVFIFIFNKYLGYVFNNVDKLIVLLSYSTYPFFLALASNILRQGIAVSLLLILVAYYIKDKKTKMILPIVVASCLFHWSAVPFCLIVLFLFKFKLNIKISISIWVVSALLYITSLQGLVIGGMTRFIPRIDLYQEQWVLNSYSGVNRIDFLIFSLFWIIFGLAMYNVFYKNEKYKDILNLYIIFNAVFLLLGFVAFSDRIAIFSWILIPLMIWYPILNSPKRNNILVLLTMLLFLIVGFLTNSMMYYGIKF